MGLDLASLPAQNDRRAWPAMRERFVSIFRTRSRDEWVAAATGRDACLAPVLSIDEAPEHPQMKARGIYAAFDGLRHPSPAPRFERTPSALIRATPAPGQNSREALSDWGLSSEEIAALESDRAMGQC
jgi:alpha-methylacyl-CoA racemase